MILFSKAKQKQTKNKNKNKTKTKQKKQKTKQNKAKPSYVLIYLGQEKCISKLALIMCNLFIQHSNIWKGDSRWNS